MLNKNFYVHDLTLSSQQPVKWELYFIMLQVDREVSGRLGDPPSIVQLGHGRGWIWTQLYLPLVFMLFLQS